MTECFYNQGTWLYLNWTSRPGCRRERAQLTIENIELADFFKMIEIDIQELKNQLDNETESDCPNLFLLFR